MFIVFPNQVFPLECFSQFDKHDFYLIEDIELFSRYKFHKHKLIMEMAALRSLHKGLIDKGYKVEFNPIKTKGENQAFEKPLLEIIRKNNLKAVHCFEIEDESIAARLEQFCKANKIKLHIAETPMFLTSRKHFKNYVEEKKRPFIRQFYQERRRKLKILVDKKGEPVGGHFIFENVNPLRLSKEIRPAEPSVFKYEHSVAEAKEIVSKHFAQNTGSIDTFWWPTNREEALAWVRDFVEKRLERYADYDDALALHTQVGFHSALSGPLNIGLITPQEILFTALDTAKKLKTPIQSLESFIHKVLGWREFVRGMYHEFGDELPNANFWKHTRTLKPCWFEGKTGLSFLDSTIQKAIRLGYNHPVERLMIVSNVMLLCEVDPQEVFRWCMEMYADASEWVTTPNVFGLGQFADGGLIASRPYICGSTYIRRMGSFEEGPWCDILDGLYWSFIEKHAAVIARNPRTAVALAPLHRLDSRHKARIFEAARKFKDFATKESPSALEQNA